MEYSGCIYGKIPSKSNSYKIVVIGGHASLTKTVAMKKYEEQFLWQVGTIRGENIDGMFELYLDVFFPSKRLDLDGCLKGFLDCLQIAKVIKNDNNCSLILARKFIDKINPRIEFKIKTLTYSPPLKQGEFLDTSA